MRWRVLTVVAAVGLVVFGNAVPAVAKGADQVTITGPGLAQPIVLSGDGEPGSGEKLGLVSQGSGLFAVMFGTSGDGQLTAQAPGGTLGIRYTLVFRIPGAPDPGTVTQDLYPSAPGGPLTYTAAGQPSFGGTTAGGWYRTDSLAFAQLLASLGLPAGAGASAAAPTTPSRAPSRVPAAAPVRSRSRSVPPAMSWVAVAAILLLLVGMVALRRRRARQDEAMR
jgi:hypothetical protein